MAKKHSSLNTFRIIDRFRVAAYSKELDVHYVFQVHGDMGERRPAEFNCHLYDSASMSHSAAVETDTVAFDGTGGIRTFATGLTLDQLVHNLDWAHLPSELAKLREMLSTRVTTNDGTLVGDLVTRSLTPEQQKHQDEVAHRRIQQEIEERVRRLTQAAEEEIRAAAKKAEESARFGLRVQVNPELNKVKTV